MNPSAQKLEDLPTSSNYTPPVFVTLLFIVTMNSKRIVFVITDYCTYIVTILFSRAQGDWALVSVWLWNFKDGGSKKVRFLAKNQHATKEKSLKNSYE